MNRRSRLRTRKQQERDRRRWAGVSILQRAFKTVNTDHQERNSDYRAQVALLHALNYVYSHDCPGLTTKS